MRPMRLPESVLLFGIPTVVFYFVTRVLIPYFNRVHNIHPILTWFMFGGLCLFIPLFVLAILLFKRDGYDCTPMTIAVRFRLVRLNKSDWRWLLDRDDSPWYPDVTLFRQQQPGDWTGVLDQVRRALLPALG